MLGDLFIYDTYTNNILCIFVKGMRRLAIVTLEMLIYRCGCQVVHLSEELAVGRRAP